MTPFEIQYLCASPFLPPLYGQVRSRLRTLVKQFSYRPDILDVGGRKSHYTISLPANIYISELPRVSEVQHKLNLGINDDIVRQTQSRRSNIRDIVFDDMTESKLPDERFDIVVAIEVLEHVAADEQFVRQVARVLRPGGTFLMTTPNGDFVPNTNPDHKRHYQASQLRDVLLTSFAEADVRYAICANRFAEMGLGSWSLGNPWKTGKSMFGNLVNSFLSWPSLVQNQSQGTCHLMATARKSPTSEKMANSTKQAELTTAM